MLKDSFGRVATDLRVSLTDRCNLRCTYCMPPEGLDWLPKPELLTDDEVVRLVGLAVRDLGVTEVRYTGGEPLLRRGLADIVRRTAEPAPRPQISLTTNGIGLDRLAAPLAAAGLDRVNVSLDTLDRETFRRLAHRDRLEDVLRGLAAARAAGLEPVKINTVLMRGINDGEAVDHVGVPVAVGELLERGGVEGVERDVDPVETGLGEGLGQAGQTDAVRGERHLRPGLQRRGAGHDVDQLAAQ